jgi:hypothetical protein
MELTDYEKAGIINKHIKECVTSIFNLNLELIAENAVQSPNQTTIDNVNDELQRQNARKAALLAEYEKLNLGE